MKYLILALFAGTLSGCWLTAPSSHMPFNASPLFVWSAGEAVSELATGKLMEDHVASALTGKNCSLTRKLSGEGKFCMTDFEIEQANRPRYTLRTEYCYSSLAQPTCYLHPSPDASDRLIGIYERPVYSAR